MAEDAHIYRVIFHSHGQIYEVFAREIYQSELHGFIEIEGGSVGGILNLTPVGGDELEGLFEAPPDLTAMGEGSMDGNEVSLELSYEGACPGQMRLRGSWELESGRLSGVLRARDCTGEAEGTFFFQRS